MSEKSMCIISRLVKDTITALPPERRCFRSVGGVLIEHNVEAARFALEKRITSEIDPQLQELETRLLAKEKQLIQIEEKLGDKHTDRQASDANEKLGGLGVLV